MLALSPAWRRREQPGARRLPHSCQGTEPGAPVFHTARPQRSRSLRWVTHRVRELRTFPAREIGMQARASPGSDFTCLFSVAEKEAEAQSCSM